LCSGSYKNVPILTFHKIDQRFEWGVTRIGTPKFRRILEYLKSNGYQTVSLHYLYHSPQKLPSKPVVITFDDSYENIYTNGLNLMEEYNFSGTIFVIAGYVGRESIWDVNLGGIRFRHLSCAQIKEMSRKGFEIGSHSMTHPDLTRIDERRLKQELKESREAIEDMIGKEVRYLSFPFGRYNKRVVEAAKECGYEKGCTFLKRIGDRERYDDFIIERRPVYLFDGIFNLKTKLERTIWTPLEDLKLRAVNFCSNGTVILKSFK